MSATPDPIREYLDAHASAYTDQALRDTLLQAGHDPDAVDAAISEWQASRRQSAADQSRFVRWALLFHAAALAAAVGWVLVFREGEQGMAGFAAVVLGIALAVGFGISFFIGRALLRGSGLVVALIAPLVSAIILGGSCIAILNSTIPPPPHSGTGRLTLTEPATMADGSATCRVYADSGYGEVQVTTSEVEGWAEVYVYLATFDQPDLSISFADGSGAIRWDYYSSPGTDLEVKVSADYLSGTATFSNLPQSDAGAPVADAPTTLAGTVSWECE